MGAAQPRLTHLLTCWGVTPSRRASSAWFGGSSLLIASLIAFMAPSNHNGYLRSTVRLLQPTNGAVETKQMIDTDKEAEKQAQIDAFRRRWEAALAANGYSRATFAAQLGPNGQQAIDNWTKRRGRVGQGSVLKVRDLLPRTNMEWLQDAVGEPERVTISDTPQRPLNPLGQSYATRLPPAILAQAVRVMEAEEHINGRNPPLKHANLLLHYCDRIAAGESVADLIVELTQG